MPRDYKHAGRGEAERKQKPVWLVFLAGLLVGLFFAGLVQVREHGVPKFVTDWVAGLRQAVPQVVPEAKPPPAPVAKEKTRPRFDFYSILPEMEVAVPEWRQAESGGASLAAGSYVLQAGSFRRPAEAESLRAELTLLGFEPEIQSVAVNGKDTWHRVRIGPINDTAKIDAIRRQLAENGIDAMLLRIRSE